MKVNATADLGRLQALEQRCASLKKDFDRIAGRNAERIDDSARLFQELRTFDSEYMEVMSSFDLTLRAPQPNEGMLDTNVTKNVAQSRLQRILHMGKSRRALIRVCFLQVVTKARQHAVALPHEKGNSNGAFGCEVGMLSRVEQHAVSEAEAEVENTGVLSSLGAYWSELATSGRAAAPIFGFGYDSSGKVLTKWMMNSWDSQPSAEMIHSELLLSKSVDISDVKLPSLNFVQAQRLIAHADLLEAKAYHSAAVQRYEKAAHLAGENGNAPLSAQALSKLSFSLKQYGSTTEALEAAGKAIELTQDPLARFVQASIQVTSGLLQNREELKMAEEQLKSVAGQLPTPELEAQRQKMRVEMMMWSWVSQGDMAKCTGIKDPARFLICVICKLIF
jgi:tetratricopeptide (TPR) repeat protein